MSSSNLRIKSLNLKTQVEDQRLNSVIQETEDVLPDLCTEVQANSLSLKTAELAVQYKLAEIDTKVQKIKESGSHSGISPSLVNSVNSLITHGAPAMTLDGVTREMDDLFQALYTERVLVDNLRFDVLEIQDRISSSMMGSKENLSNGKNSRSLSPRTENKSREQDVVRKGIDRLEKQIFQYTQTQITKDHKDIALLKKCKTT